MAGLVLGTAGHIDHGKTALVRALTGTDTDRLPEERARGISIALGYARLDLPSGRALSVIDVPGHERFVRTMVAGATGIDLFLLCVAADDGVMPQTEEHLRVLGALGVSRGVVAVTKSDLGPVPDLPELRAEVVPVSVRQGWGVDAVAAALDRATVSLEGRHVDPEATQPAVLHVDRVFSVRGAGTVVTGTLWAGRIARGDAVTLLPSGRTARVREVQVHDVHLDAAEAGQRVALNLAGTSRDDVARGDVVTTDASLQPRHVLEATLDPSPPARIMVHHGTRETAARVVRRGEAWSLRCERPLIARPGDRLVIRSIAPPDTLGGGTVLPPPPEPASSEPAVEPAPTRRTTRTYRGTSDPEAAWATIEPLLPATLAQARDALGVGRKEAQLLLEHFDATGRTLRRGDVRLPRRSRAGRSDG